MRYFANEESVIAVTVEPSGETIEQDSFQGDQNSMCGAAARVFLVLFWAMQKSTTTSEDKVFVGRLLLSSSFADLRYTQLKLRGSLHGKANRGSAFGPYSLIKVIHSKNT